MNLAFVLLHLYSSVLTIVLFSKKELSNPRESAAPNFQTPRSSSKYCAALRIFKCLTRRLEMCKTRDFYLPARV